MAKLKLKRRLERLIIKKDELETQHKGKELNYTYWGGFDLGYLKGKVSQLEDIIDDIEMSQNQ